MGYVNAVCVFDSLRHQLELPRSTFNAEVEVAIKNQVGVLACHPSHNVPREAVDKICHSALIRSIYNPKDSTAIQYFYLRLLNQTLGKSHLPFRLQRGFRSCDSHFVFIVKHGGRHR